MHLFSDSLHLVLAAGRHALRMAAGQKRFLNLAHTPMKYNAIVSCSNDELWRCAVQPIGRRLICGKGRKPTANQKSLIYRWKGQRRTWQRPARSYRVNCSFQWRSWQSIATEYD